jgi:hypothetical protein
MKELKTCLFEAISSGRHTRGIEFPEDPDIEAIASFLEYKGFERYVGPLTLPKYSNYYNKDTYEIGFHGKQFSMYRCGDNAMFCIWLGNHDKYYGNFGDFASNPGAPYHFRQMFYKTYDEFRDAVMDHYGW